MKIPFAQTYKTAPNGGKIIIILGYVAVGIGLWYLGSTTLRRIRAHKALKGQRAVVDDAKKEISVLANQGQKASYADVWYTSQASAIKAAIDGCDPFDDDQGAIQNAINQMKNDLDVQKLITAWGVRKWDRCGWWTGDAEMDFVGMVREELSSNEIAILNTILQRKGITFRF